MTYRPYPNVDRSLRQVARHAIPEELPEWRVKLAADARRALAAAGEAWSLTPVRRSATPSDRSGIVVPVP